MILKNLQKVKWNEETVLQNTRTYMNLKHKMKKTPAGASRLRLHKEPCKLRYTFLSKFSYNVFNLGTKYQMQNLENENFPIRNWKHLILIRSYEIWFLRTNRITWKTCFLLQEE